MCPAGYHETSYYCNLSCLGSCPDNAVNCEADVGQSFGACGLTCPTGYHSTSTYCNLSCLGSCPNNAVNCTQN